MANGTYSAMGVDVGGVAGGSVQGDINSLPMFAKGGIANQPSIFGEAGWEAAVPLPDGRSIPVTISGIPAANDSNLPKTIVPNQTFSPIFVPQQQPASESNKELVEEVKKLRAELKVALDVLNKKTEEGNNVRRTGFSNVVQENKNQTTSLRRLETKTRIQNNLTGTNG